MGRPIDPSSTTFIIIYNKLILRWKSLFYSEQALFKYSKTKDMVNDFASSKADFSKVFSNSMIKDEQPYRR
ncbi:hypothetical protein H5410_006128 [Solanum commersonii]|uniref:Uncharacterized protein n=1 Tax=Solanum commersonii TaxID=4109 RepID=A0A9J6A8B1_SOLCO|nr:hypothetical protein H5410_006128 [Solanum commersonii]